MGDQRGMLVSGNWRMHENHFEALKFAQEPGGGISARYAVIALDHGSAPSVNVAVGLGGGDCGGR